jgi:hypothetical protein
VRERRRRHAPDVRARSQRDIGGMISVTIPIATVIARDAVRRQFKVKLRAR